MDRTNHAGINTNKMKKHKQLLRYKLTNKEINTNPIFDNKITSSKDAQLVAYQFWDEDTISLSESFYLAFVNRQNQLIGYALHSIGGIAGTMADLKLIFAQTILSGASGLIVYHNHPSGNFCPSTQDNHITTRIKDVSKMLEINFLDHIIITPNPNIYYSFADEGKL
jgi:DNA repair protein RadC